MDTIFILRIYEKPIKTPLELCVLIFYSESNLRILFYDESKAYAIKCEGVDMINQFDNVIP